MSQSSLLVSPSYCLHNDDIIIIIIIITAAAITTTITTNTASAAAAAIEFSLSGSSPYSRRQIRINIHKRNSTKTQYKQYKTR